MIDDFDHILKQLLGKLPEHSPKSEVWNKISGKLDEDLAMSRIRRVLKNNEHKPKTDLWPAIESFLNRPVFWKILFRSAWVKYVLPSFVVLTTLFFVKPYFNTEQKLAYNKPLQRNANTSEIISDKTIAPANLNKAPFANPDLSVKKNDNNIPVINSVINNFQGNTNSNSVLPDEKKLGVQLPENNLKNENHDLISQTSVAENIRTDNININSVTPLSLLMIEDKWMLKNPLIAKSNSTYPEDASAKKGLGHGNFSLEYSYAPEMSFMSLKNNSDDYNIDLKKRKQAEQYSYSSTTGLEGKVDFRHWFFQTGVNYSKITTASEFRFNYSGIDTVGWHLDTMFVYIWYDSLGCHDSLMYSWSPVVGEVSHENVKAPSYQLRYLQIPLIAGYSISRGKFQYAVSGGVSLGIPLSISGRMIEPDNYTISNVESQPLSLRKIVFNGILRAGVNYFISPHYSVFAQPSLRYTLNSVFDKNYPVSQKYLTCGLRFGITYRF